MAFKANRRNTLLVTPQSKHQQDVFLQPLGGEDYLAQGFRKLWGVCVVCYSSAVWRQLWNALWNLVGKDRQQPSDTGSILPWPDIGLIKLDIEYGHGWANVLVC